MIIERMYLMTWLQRTTIHLKEMYYFFTRKYDALTLDPKHLDHLMNDLALDHVTLSIHNDFEVLKASAGGFTFSASEDGIFTLSTTTNNVAKGREKLESYYRKHLGPALGYLFGRGAPLPKQLSNLTEIYPIVVVVRDCSEQDVKRLLTTLGETYETSVASRTVQMFFGSTFVVARIIAQGKHPKDLEEILANMVFLREFEKQLHYYLNVHRTMWDEISAIRESRQIRYREFPIVRRKIMDFLKTLFFVKARLSQMRDINKARHALLRPVIRKELQALGLFRFENTIADQDYIYALWKMTIAYVEETLELLESLFQENTQRELGTLKFITFIGALTGFFGMNIAFPWEDRWISTFPSSFAVIAVITIASFAFYYLLRSFIYNRFFTIREKT